MLSTRRLRGDFISCYYLDVAGLTTRYCTTRWTRRPAGVVNFLYFLPLTAPRKCAGALERSSLRQASELASVASSSIACRSAPIVASGSPTGIGIADLSVMIS